MRTLFAIIATVCLTACSSNKGRQQHSNEARAHFEQIAHCTKTPMVDLSRVKIREETVHIKFPGSFRDPSGVQVHGYAQKLGDHSYFFKSIDDHRVRHHERGHIHMWERKIPGAHPRQYSRCFFLWRLRTYNDAWQDEIEIIDTVYDEHGNRIGHKGD